MVTLASVIRKGEKMKESEIEWILVRDVRKVGGRAYKWVSPGNDGVPDQIVIFPDRQPIFVELKAEGGRLSRLQKFQIERLSQLGQYVAVVKGINGLIQFFQDCGYTEISDELIRRYGCF